MTKIIAVVNQKGGVGKTTTCVSLGAGLVREGKRVLCIDLDPQASLSIAMGISQPDMLDFTITDIIRRMIDEKQIPHRAGIHHHDEGMDFIPSSIDLSAMEMQLISCISREAMLRQYLDTVKGAYDYILVDCMPSLGMMTVNALAAANSVLIPVQAQYLSAKGLEQLLQTVNRVRRTLNPKLAVEGILLTMVDMRTNNAREISTLLREQYGALNVFDTIIPFSVRAAETSIEGKSILSHDPAGKVAAAYQNLTKEVIKNARQKASGLQVDR